MMTSNCDECGKTILTSKLIEGKCYLCQQDMLTNKGAVNYGDSGEDDSNKPPTNLSVADPNKMPFLKANSFGVLTIILLSTILLVGIFLTSVTPSSDLETLRPTKASVSCSFDRHSAAKPPNGSAADFRKAATYLAFVDGKTSSKTGKLDGAVRATNSNQWYELKSDYGGLSLIGDGGDLLVIWAKPEDGVGIFTASLQWSYMPTYAFTSLGKCSLER
jgi:hypothetical protein